MNAFNFMLNAIHKKIPKEILDIGFTLPQFDIYTKIDERIMQNVFRERLLLDMNIASKEPFSVPLTSCNTIKQTDTTLVISVPKKYTGNRTIVSVHNISPDGYGVYGNIDHPTDVVDSPILNSAVKMLNGTNDTYISQTSRVSLIGENTVLIEENLWVSEGLYLHGTVANDANLVNIDASYYKDLAHMAVLLTKAEIYNNTIINMERGAIGTGHSHEYIREIISGYADADEMYEQYFDEKWRKQAYMQNSSNMDDFVNIQIGHNI